MTILPAFTSERPLAAWRSHTERGILNRPLIRVVVADNDDRSRAEVLAILAPSLLIAVVATASALDAAADAVVRERPDVIVTTLAPTVRFIRSFPAMSPRVKEVMRLVEGRTILLQDQPVADGIILALAAGCAGYLSRAEARTQLVDAIRVVRGGKLWIPVAASAALAPLLRRTFVDEDPRERLQLLTPREAEVLRATAEGHPIAAIAVRLGISAKTVETYKHRLSLKLGLVKRHEFVAFARRSGLLDDDILPGHARD